VMNEHENIQQPKGRGDGDEEVTVLKVKLCQLRAVAICPN